jgi:hypothetical protein
MLQFLRLIPEEEDIESQEDAEANKGDDAAEDDGRNGGEDSLEDGR